MGVLHFIQGVTRLVISKETLTEIQRWLPKVDPVRRASVLQPEKWHSVNLGYTIASCLLLSALAHFITVIPSVYRWYLNNLKYTINLIRWHE